MKSLVLIVMFLFTSCNFDVNKDRAPCDGRCDVNGASFTATINFINELDASQASCPMDFNARTFNMSNYSGGPDDMFSGEDSLVATIEASTGLDWEYDPATCLIQSSDAAAVDDTVELPFYDNSVSGTVFFDGDVTSGDLDLSAGDTPIANVLVTMTCGIATYTQTTDAAGNYSFSNVLPGDCSISTDPDTIPTGYVNSYDEDNDRDHEFPIVVAPTGTHPANDFGYAPNDVSGTIFFDIDTASGDLDIVGGDTPISGVTVVMTCGSDVQTTTTDSAGQYNFVGVPIGSCSLSVDTTTIPSGFSNSFDEDSDFDNEFSITVSFGSHPDNDFGYASNKVSGTVFTDENIASGDLDIAGGDAGLVGITVTLTCGTDVMTTTTDANGEYSFMGVAAGACTLQVDPATLPAGFTNTFDEDSDQDHEFPVNVTAVGVFPGNDFGYSTNHVSGTVFLDADTSSGDLNTGAGDTGLVGITVQLTCGTTVLTTTTDAAGEYEFSNVSSGACSLSVDPATLPAGYINSYDEDSDQDHEFPITVAAVGTHPANDFGYAPTAVVTFFHIDQGAVATCPLDFTLRAFDMTAYAGTAADTFANVAALETALEAATSFDWVYDTATCRFTSNDVGAIDGVINLDVRVCDPFTPDFTVSNGSFRLDALTTTPSNGGNYLIEIVNTGTSAVAATYANGTFFDINQHFAEGQTVELLPGSYEGRITTAQCKVEFDVPVPQYSACNVFKQVNYDGPTSGPGATPRYQIPITPGVTSVNVGLNSLVIADQLQLFYNGSLIHDTGSIATGNNVDTANVPITYVPGVDFVEVQMTPDPSSGTQTIWNFSIGCCPTKNCNEPLPERDILVASAAFSSCGMNWTILSPYTHRSYSYNPSSNRIFSRYSTNKNQCFTDELNPSASGCIVPPGESALIDNALLGFGKRITTGGCSSAVRLLENSCQDVFSGLASMNSTEIIPSEKIIWSFPDAAGYLAIKNKFQIVTAGRDPGVVMQGTVSYKVESCVSDSPTIVRFPRIRPEMISFNDATNEITIDDTVPNSVADCCNNLGTPTDTWHGMSGAKSFSTFNFTEFRSSAGATSPVATNLKVTSECGSYERDYNLYWDPADPENTWQMWSGDNVTGTLVQEHSSFQTLGLNSASNCQAGAGIQNSDGYLLGCDQIDFSTDIYNLTNIASGATQTSFVDGNDLASYLTGVIAGPWSWRPDVCMLNNDSPGLNFYNTRIDKQ